ncbi:DUF4367 domain-containing protein [Oribacterium sp. WCC10]|uniref:DUF4367 domain-containing protein n=1 Tax=Oribacterium sp. WCC10 TaxID=1855343 RepID=UPI0008EB407F|nr:DUF4367 domain-containing protein [Oribacterium sp. WCC10]SFG09569.1 hypothetical protein SAMN05216356_101227 [Oribacterium sp. WCC10]
MYRYIKKYLYIVLITMAMPFIVSCGARKQPKETVSAEELSQDIITGIAEGFKNGEIDVTSRERKLISNLIDYVVSNPESSLITLKEAAQRAGFNAVFPDDISGAKPYFTAISGILEASYVTDDGNEIIIRKSEDKDAPEMELPEGINGIKVTKNIDGKEVSLISEDDKIYTVSWENAEKAYSIISENGIDEDTLKSIIKEVK